MLAITLVGGSAKAANTCLNPSFTAFSRCSADDKGDITVGTSTCKQAYLDRTPTQVVGLITIATGGTLVITDQAAQGGIGLKTSGIDIQSGGTLKIGDPACPIGTTKAADLVTLTFTGTHPADCGDITKGPGYTQCQGYVKGIQVESGGSLYMYGLKGVPASGDTTHTMDWTYLADAAGPTSPAGVRKPAVSATQIKVAGDVTGGGTNRGWQAGDWIAVATTSFSPWQTEFVQIKNLSYNGTTCNTTINLGNASADQKLVYYHFGGDDPYAADKGAPGPNSYNASDSTNLASTNASKSASSAAISF
jgi:G8 domain